MQSCQPGWKRTNDVYAHSPKFDITCKHCKDKMIVRHTRIMWVAVDVPNPANFICYKCPNCGWIITFEVMDDIKYLRKIAREFRHGAMFYIPDAQEWADESPEIAKKLQSLGYFGG